MNAMDIGKRLVALCNEGKNMDAVNELYSDDIVSVEAFDIPGMGRTAKGIDAIRGKHEWWYGAHDVHSASAEGPYLHGDDQFIVKFTMDVTHKESGERFTGDELGVYSVADGKVAKEQFFSPPMG